VRSDYRPALCRSCIFLSWPLLAASLAQSAVPHYVVDTEAGYVPADTRVARAQYLDSPAAVAYDAAGTLYVASSNKIWHLKSDGTITLVAGPTVEIGAMADRRPKPRLAKL